MVETKQSYSFADLTVDEAEDIKDSIVQGILEGINEERAKIKDGDLDEQDLPIQTDLPIHTDFASIVKNMLSQVISERELRSMLRLKLWHQPTRAIRINEGITDLKTFNQWLVLYAERIKESIYWKEDVEHPVEFKRDPRWRDPEWLEELFTKAFDALYNRATKSPHTLEKKVVRLEKQNAQFKKDIKSLREQVAELAKKVSELT